jgi:hypothetical protein
MAASSRRSSASSDSPLRRTSMHRHCASSVGRCDTLADGVEVTERDLAVTLDQAAMFLRVLITALTSDAAATPGRGWRAAWVAARVRPSCTRRDHFPSWHSVAGRPNAARWERGSPFHSLGNSEPSECPLRPLCRLIARIGRGIGSRSLVTPITASIIRKWAGR